MNTPRLALQQALDDCEVRILSAARHSRQELRDAATYAHGIAHGYFMAGVADHLDYAAASDRIREITDLALRQVDSLQRAA